jgi:hypothetical protein
MGDPALRRLGPGLHPTPSLDDPQAIRPTAHIWCGSGLSGFAVDDDLPRFADGQLTHPSRRRSWRAD